MRKLIHRVRVLALAACGPMLAASGCGQDSAECAGVGEMGLVIGVSGEDTGEALCEASVHLVHADYTDDLVASGPDPCKYLGGVVEGHYTIEISAEGYAPATREVDLKPAATCSGFEVQEIEVALTPEVAASE